MSARRGGFSWHRFDELCGHPIRQNSLLFIFPRVVCARTLHDVCHWLKISRLYLHCHLPKNIHITSIPSMLARERSTPSSTITSQVTLPINKPCAQDPQTEEYGSVAKTTSSTRTAQRAMQRTLAANQECAPDEKHSKYQLKPKNQL